MILSSVKFIRSFARGRRHIKHDPRSGAVWRVSACYHFTKSNDRDRSGKLAPNGEGKRGTVLVFTLPANVSFGIISELE